jgi:RimJ/RimL family protein N-acetyltransferase
MIDLVTERISLRPITIKDAAQLLRLMNQPSYYAGIGDRGVRTLEDAQRTIETKFIKQLAETGFGYWSLVLKQTGDWIGFCGLLKRDSLPTPDLGYALLDEFTGNGYAREATQAVVEHASSELKLRSLCAIVAPENLRSVKLLTEIGFHKVKQVQLLPDPKVLDYYEILLNQK